MPPLTATAPQHLTRHPSRPRQLARVTLCGLPGSGGPTPLSRTAPLPANAERLARINSHNGLNSMYPVISSSFVQSRYRLSTEVTVGALPAYLTARLATVHTKYTLNYPPPIRFSTRRGLARQRCTARARFFPPVVVNTVGLRSLGSRIVASFL